MLGADPSRRCWERVRTRKAISPRANRCVRAGEAARGALCTTEVNESYRHQLLSTRSPWRSGGSARAHAGACTQKPRPLSHPRRKKTPRRPTAGSDRRAAARGEVVERQKFRMECAHEGGAPVVSETQTRLPWTPKVRSRACACELASEHALGGRRRGRNECSTC